MKDLLIALRKRLSNNLVYLGGEKAVHIVPDENLLPETTTFPCVSLKDGDILSRYYVNSTRRFMDVNIISYVNINAIDGAILGTTKQKGILDMMADVREALHEYDPEGYRNVITEESTESASETLDFGEVMVQKKKMVMRWVTE